MLRHLAPIQEGRQDAPYVLRWRLRLGPNRLDQRRPHFVVANSTASDWVIHLEEVLETSPDKP